MDKVSEALQELIRQGGPVAQQAIYYWFGVRVIDALSDVLIAGVIMGGLCFIGFKIIHAVREYNQSH